MIHSRISAGNTWEIERIIRHLWQCAAKPTTKLAPHVMMNGDYLRAQPTYGNDDVPIAYPPPSTYSNYVRRTESNYYLARASRFLERSIHPSQCVGT